MWPYTHDESNWLAVIDVLGSTRPHPYPPTVAEIERAARRYRARVIAGWMKSAFRSVRRFARSALHRGRAEPKPPPGGVVTAD